MSKKDEYNSIRMPRLRLESVEEVVEAEPNQEGEGKQEARERIQRLRRDYTRQKASKRKVGEENSESDDDRSDRMVTEGPKKRLKLLEQDTSSGGKIGSKDNFTTIIDKNEEKETKEKNEEAAKEEKAKDKITEWIREVDPCETHYFVEFLEWPEDEVLAAVARQQDAEDRHEVVARASRARWAQDLLLDLLWARVKMKRDIKRWSREIILSKLDKVILNRNIIFHLVDRIVEDKEEEKRKKRVEIGRKKRDELIEIINGKMEVVDQGKEDRIEKVKKLQALICAMDTDEIVEMMDVEDRDKVKRLAIAKKRQEEFLRMEEEDKVLQKKEEDKRKKMQKINDRRKKKDREEKELKDSRTKMSLWLGRGETPILPTNTEVKDKIKKLKNIFEPVKKKKEESRQEGRKRKNMEWETITSKVRKIGDIEDGLVKLDLPGKLRIPGGTVVGTVRKWEPGRVGEEKSVVNAGENARNVGGGRKNELIEEKNFQNKLKGMPTPPVGDSEYKFKNKNNTELGKEDERRFSTPEARF